MIEIIAWESASITLMSLWVVVWIALFFVSGKRGEDVSSRDSLLKRYSLSIVVLLFIFYFLSFAKVGEVSSFSETGGFIDLLRGSAVRFGAFALAYIGALMMIAARWELRALSLGEMLFSNSTRLVESGIYRYCKHPMYVGMFLMIISALFFYPNPYALIVGMIALFFTIKKIRRENSL